MTVSRALRIVRVTLAGGTLTQVIPPGPFTNCYVSNTTTADLKVFTNNDQTQNEFRVIAAQYERPFRASVPAGFRYDEPAFWLLSVPGGTVILEWT